MENGVHRQKLPYLRNGEIVCVRGGGMSKTRTNSEYKTEKDSWQNEARKGYECNSMYYLPSKEHKEDHCKGVFTVDQKESDLLVDGDMLKEIIACLMSLKLET